MTRRGTGRGVRSTRPGVLHGGRARSPRRLRPGPRGARPALRGPRGLRQPRRGEGAPCSQRGASETCPGRRLFAQRARGAHELPADPLQARGRGTRRPRSAPASSGLRVRQTAVRPRLEGQRGSRVPARGQRRFPEAHAGRARSTSRGPHASRPPPPAVRSQTRPPRAPCAQPAPKRGCWTGGHVAGGPGSAPNSWVKSSFHLRGLELSRGVCGGEEAT